MGRGLCLPTNEHMENWSLPGSVRIRDRVMINYPCVHSLANTTLGPSSKASNSWLLRLSPSNCPPFVPVCCPYHSYGAIVVRTLLGLNNNRNTQCLGYWGSLIAHTGGHKFTHCMSIVRLVSGIHIWRRGGLKIYWGYAQSLGQEYTLPEVRTLPPRNLGKVYWLVAINTH